MSFPIDLTKPSLYISAASIIFNPTFWNFAARQEYNNKWISRNFGGDYPGCYALAISIFSLGILRDALYANALEDQPKSPFLLSWPYSNWVAYGLIGMGNTLVLSSMWALGITGTYLGDYFGILMDEPVTGFPFNVSGAPMYVGSTINFVGTAILYKRPAGFALSTLVWICYSIALRLEDPFTETIYKKRDEQRKQGKREK